MPRAARVFAALVIALGALTSASAHAGEIWGPACSIGTGLVLCGTTAGIADPMGEKKIVIRDQTNLPLAGVTVTLDLSACTAADIRLCATQPDPAIAVSCGVREVSAITDAAGVATFHVIGYALNPGGGTPGAPAAGYGMSGAVVRANGLVLGTLIVGAYDQNGAAGASTVDLALVANDRFSVTGPAGYRGRSDLNGDGAVNSIDLAREAQVVFSGGSTAGCPSTCP